MRLYAWFLVLIGEQYDFALYGFALAYRLDGMLSRLGQCAILRQFCLHIGLGGISLWVIIDEVGHVAIYLIACIVEQREGNGAQFLTFRYGWETEIECRQFSADGQRQLTLVRLTSQVGDRGVDYDFIESVSPVILIICIHIGGQRYGHSHGKSSVIVGDDAVLEQHLVFAGTASPPP